jgi:4,5-dihydroxyphthalate decarboxylase
MTLSFTFAISSYDHAEEIVNGTVPIVDADPLFVRLPIPEMFRRFVKQRDWDVSEMSFVQYATMRVGGDDSIVGIPVFPSRLYRQTAIFVRSDRIRTPEDLRGARMGIAGWSNSAAVWGRGLLDDMHGVGLRDVTWFQAGIDRPGRSDPVPARFLDPAVTVVPVTDRSLEEMTWSGDLDGMIVPSPPPSIERSAASGGLIRVLYDDPARAEQEYRERTGCLPIMHLVALTRDLYEQDNDIVRRLFDAFEVARARYLSRLRDDTASLVFIPWVDEHIASLTAALGDQLWPYGVEPNDASLRTFLRYLHTQGLTECRPEPATLFPEWCAAVA